MQPDHYTDKSTPITRRNSGFSKLDAKRWLRTSHRQYLTLSAPESPPKRPRTNMPSGQPQATSERKFIQRQILAGADTWWGAFRSVWSAAAEQHASPCPPACIAYCFSYLPLLKSKLIWKSVIPFIFDCFIGFAAKHEHTPSLKLYKRYVITRTISVSI